MKLNADNIEDVFKSKKCSKEKMKKHGYKLVKTLFADSSGKGLPNEPSLTQEQLIEQLGEIIEKHGPVHSKIINTGKYQLYLGIFKETEKSEPIEETESDGELKEEKTVYREIRRKRKKKSSNYSAEIESTKKRLFRPNSYRVTISVFNGPESEREKVSSYSFNLKKYRDGWISMEPLNDLHECFEIYSEYENQEKVPSEQREKWAAAWFTDNMMDRISKNFNEFKEAYVE